MIEQLRGKDTVYAESLLARSLQKALAGVPPASTVALEGPPIYLDQEWKDTEHGFGYNVGLIEARRILSSRFCRTTHYVLLDEYTVEPRLRPEHYLKQIQPPIDRVAYESSFAKRAHDIRIQIGDRRLKRPDGRPISLTTQSGRIPCVLLDAAFQINKEAANFNVVIHPIEFKHEQEEVREVMKVLHEGKLPFTLINIYFKGQVINKVFITEANGREERVV